MNYVARAACVATLVCLGAAAAIAHERKAAGRLVLTIGWEEEPALAGFRNAVDVSVAEASGAPAVDPAGSLTVEVSFGSDRITLSLVASGRQPGRYRAPLIPTRAGSYTLHVFGTVKQQAIDVSSSCSDKTFECVADAADLQFPAKDPTPGQIAERVARALPRAEEASGRAASARLMALGAIAIAGAAVVIALTRRPRAPGARPDESSRV